jgi:hypothetical protein
VLFNNGSLPRKRSQVIDFYSFKNAGLPLSHLWEREPRRGGRALLLGKAPSPTSGRGNKLRCAQSCFRGKNQ